MDASPPPQIAPFVRVEVAALPVPALVGGVDVQVYAAPVWVLAGGTLGQQVAGWSLDVAWPLASVGALTFGPLVGLAQPWGATASPDFGPTPFLPSPGPLLPAVGVVARVESEHWWMVLAPTLFLTSQNLGLIAPLETGPPALEIGWKVTSRLGIGLRTNIAPVIASYAF